MGMFSDRLVEFMRTFSHNDVYQSRSRKFRNVFGFYGAKENSGTTTLLVNVAYLLATKGKSILVLDFHLNQPGVFRYLLPELRDEEFAPKAKSLNDKFINSSIHTREFAMVSSVCKGVYLASANPDELPDKYCSINEEYVTNMIKEAAATYDVVLIDIDTDLRYETTTAAIDCSDFIFSVITPQPECVEILTKNNYIVYQAKFGDKLKFVIQNLMRDSNVTAVLKEVGLDPIMAVPYSDAVRKIGDNYRIFVNGLNGDDIGAVKYVECCKQLAEVILGRGDA